MTKKKTKPEKAAAQPPETIDVEFILGGLQARVDILEVKVDYLEAQLSTLPPFLRK